MSVVFSIYKQRFLSEKTLPDCVKIDKVSISCEAGTEFYVSRRKSLAY